jgi:superoxide dismutase, Cu-Zn family
MKKQILALGFLGALCLVGRSWLYAQESPVKVDLRNAQGQSVGVATLSPEGTGISIALDLKNLPPGEHAVHIHQRPGLTDAAVPPVVKCDPPNFESAGPHFNPLGKKHGLQNPQGPHAGDNENFTVGPDGTARTTLTNPRVSLGSGSNSVFSDRGTTALVIHAQADDMKTDPAGNAGPRIACGVISK